MMGLSDVPADLSSTCFQQQWSIPRGSKITPEAVPHMTIIQPKPDRKQGPIKNTIKDCRKIKVEEKDIEHLKSLMNFPISYVAVKPTRIVDTHLGQVGVGSGLSTHAKFYEAKHVPSVDTVCGDLPFPKKAPIHLPEEYHPLPADIVISQEKAQELEECTRDQAQCPQWFEARQTRITASKFHEVMHRKTISDKYLSRLLFNKNQSCAAMEYGKRKEKNARKAYVAKAGNHVHDCGLIINPAFPHLGATPDGKVCENGKTGILEIKCPFSARQMKIEEALSLPNFCLEERESCVKLRENHSYYTQVQGQLLVTGAEFCDFVVFTPKETFIERIKPNQKCMSDILSKLSNIYFEHVRPFLAINKC
ncbi:uncharacterized protein [Argopecten irradians]|uniref:uncharacterized protein n=1 Tax=Argopecten irradians TaxID=31199 RepID=UPI0037244B88